MIFFKTTINNYKLYDDKKTELLKIVYWNIGTELEEYLRVLECVFEKNKDIINKTKGTDDYTKY